MSGTIFRLLLALEEELGVSGYDNVFIEHLITQGGRHPDVNDPRGHLQLVLEARRTLEQVRQVRQREEWLVESLVEEGKPVSDR